MVVKDLIKKYKEMYAELTKYHAYSYNEENIYKTIINDLEQYEKKIEETKILLVEDGSIDIEKEKSDLEDLGYKIIVYRQNSNKPEIINR